MTTVPPRTLNIPLRTHPDGVDLYGPVPVPAGYRRVKLELNRQAGAASLESIPEGQCQIALQVEMNSVAGAPDNTWKHVISTTIQSGIIEDDGHSLPTAEVEVTLQNSSSPDRTLRASATIMGGPVSYSGTLTWS